ncbi:GH3 auxin-responsive promoter family protein [Aurantibacter crassamenti]|uniref:GH3 family domain-containing protein n=1 Tax=Aurantibacter crassamenti TaxID=1837375 RepID=UPI00193A52E7|nr:GH3 auxin-responsive promoter family protein [Aurantibacter crassamenti]MBM1104595.1 GH3 auxin-responsive promoter family protein [Aurantibacter crassamenti]
MHIVGSIIKGLIDLKDKLTPESSPSEEQKKVLKDLLEKAQDTEFGKCYDFKTIGSNSDMQKTFSEKIPFFDYNQINEKWWRKLHKGQTNVTWPGTPSYYALSSGTTGKTSKRIPVTNDMIDAIKSTGIAQVSALSNYDLPPTFFEKGILMLGSSTDLKEKENHLEGEISGISASNIPSWFKGYYKPGEEIAQIDDWDERVLRIAEKAKDWDIGAISGIPSWIELMLAEVIAYHKVKNIHEIWPNLEVYTSGGVAFGPYEKSFNALLGRPITVIDTYLASEGFIAFQSRPETDAMKLATDNGIYFEFVPFDPEYINQDGSLVANAPSLTLDEVKTDQDYVLIISTVSGAWRYLIGDTIEFTDVERAEIKITGRTKFFLNTVGSQLSVNKLNDGVKHLEETFDIKIPEYTLCAKRFDDEFYHSWYLGTEASIDSNQLAESIDKFLQQANKNYKVARSKALKGVKVATVSPSVFHEWNGANKKKGGQVKMERVMGEDKFAEWEEFVAQQ